MDRQLCILDTRAWRALGPSQRVRHAPSVGLAELSLVVCVSTASRVSVLLVAAGRWVPCGALEPVHPVQRVLVARLFEELGEVLVASDGFLLVQGRWERSEVGEVDRANDGVSSVLSVSSQFARPHIRPQPPTSRTSLKTPIRRSRQCSLSPPRNSTPLLSSLSTMLSPLNLPCRLLCRLPPPLPPLTPLDSPSSTPGTPSRPSRTAAHTAPP